jgi:hypothetical protein
MGNTPSVKEMIAVVEDYIYYRKRVRVKISLDNAMRLHRDIVMLNEAYSIAVMYNNKDK